MDIATPHKPDFVFSSSVQKHCGEKQPLKPPHTHFVLVSGRGTIPAPGLRHSLGVCAATFQLNSSLWMLKHSDQQNHQAEISLIADFDTDCGASGS